MFFAFSIFFCFLLVVNSHSILYSYKGKYLIIVRISTHLFNKIRTHMTE